MSNSLVRSKFFTRTYGLMAISLLISFVSSYIFAQTPLVNIFSGFGSWGTVVWLVILGFELFVTGKIYQLSVTNPTAGLISLLCFSAFDGMTFAGALAWYSPQLVAYAFVSSAVLFGVMSFLGVVIKKDMTKLRGVLSAAFIALMVVWIVELFLRSPMIILIFSFVGVVIFSGMIMTTTNRLNKLADNYGADSSGLPIAGALSLYIEFMNLFNVILNIFGFGYGNN